MKISVVIPYYNESLTLEKTLNSLIHQTLKPFEILLVDSGSTDDSNLVINNFISNNNINNISVHRSGEMTPSSSINLGVKKSRSDLIAYIDCGLNIPLNWLESKSIRLSRVSVITAVEITPSVMTNTESEMILRLYNPFDR